MRDSDVFAALRRARRYKLFEPVRLHFSGDWSRGHLLDLSATGALGHAVRPPARGDLVRVEGETLCLTGHVMWAHGKHFGIGFSIALAETTVARIVEGH